MRTTCMYRAVLDTGVVASSRSLDAVKQYAQENAQSEYAVFRERAALPNAWRAIGGVRRVGARRGARAAA